MAFIGTLTKIKLQGNIRAIINKKFRQVELVIVSNGTEYIIHTTRKQIEKNNFYIGKDIIFWFRSTDPMLFEIDESN